VPVGLEAELVTRIVMVLMGIAFGCGRSSEGALHGVRG